MCDSCTRHQSPSSQIDQPQSGSALDIPAFQRAHRRLSELVERKSTRALSFTLSVESNVITVNAQTNGVGRKGAFLRRNVRYSGSMPVCQLALLHPQRYIVSKYCGLAEFTGFESVSDSEVAETAQQAVADLIEKIIRDRNRKKGR